MQDWEQYKTRVPFPKNREKHVILKDQEFNQDKRTAGKVLLGTDKGLVSVWPSQLAPIADYFCANPKAEQCKIEWQIDQLGRVHAVVQSL